MKPHLFCKGEILKYPNGSPIVILVSFRPLPGDLCQFGSDVYRVIDAPLLTKSFVGYVGADANLIVQVEAVKSK
jgi:hypothetical protein